MAITYESIQSNTAGGGTTVVVTKPVGLAVGDLMIAKAIYTNTSPITLPSGFSTIHTGLTGTLRRFVTGYKIADAGDVAASNFTFTFGATIGDASASLLRFSTTLVFPANPILSSLLVISSTSTGTPSLILNLNSGPLSSFLIANYFTNINTTSTGQASTPSRTWTERHDYNRSTISTSTATAPNSASENIESFTLSVTSNTGHNLSFFIIAESASVTTDISHLAVTPAIEGIVPQVNVNPDIGHLYTEPTVEGILGRASSDQTQWNNTPKPTETEWNNTSK